MPLVSVVVPVYNVEMHLDKCVQSLVDQSLSDIEIILVDDGSTDESSSICDSWAQRDERILVVHKENGGLSDARNLGVAYAQADYVGFIDGDDYVDAQMFDVLYGAIKRHDVGLAACDVTFEPRGLKRVFGIPSERTEDGLYILDAEVALRESVLSRLPRIWAPTKLYPKRVFDDGFAFPLGKTFEDAFTIVDLLSRFEKIAVDPRGFYHYVDHGGGTISSASFSDRTYDIIDAWENSAAQAAVFFPRLKEEFEFRCHWARYTVLDKMILSGLASSDPRLKDVVSYLKENKHKILANKYVGKGRKIAIRFLCVSVRAYRQFALFEARRVHRI